MGTGTSVHVSTDLPGIWFTGTLMHQVHGALLVYLLFEVDPEVDILQSGDRQHFSVSVFEVLLDDLVLKVRVAVEMF